MKAVNGTLHFDYSSFDYISFGRGKRDLVIIPGLGDGLITVKGKALIGSILLRDFAKEFRVTVISRKNELKDMETTASMAEDQYLAMKKLGIEKAFVAGISQGGMIAQHLAASHPEIIEKLALVVTVPKANEMLINNCRRWQDMALKEDYKAIMIDINEMAHTREDLKKIKPFYPFMGFGKPDDFKRFIIQSQACITHDAGTVLSKITAPTLIVGGKKDVTLGYEGSLELHEKIEGSELFIYPDMGHALYEDAKDFNKRIIDFFLK